MDASPMFGGGKDHAPWTYRASLVIGIVSFLFGTVGMLLTINQQNELSEELEKLQVLQESGISVNIEVLDLQTVNLRIRRGYLVKGVSENDYIATIQYAQNPFQHYTRIVDIPMSQATDVYTQLKESFGGQIPLIKALAHPNDPTFFDYPDLIDWRMERAREAQSHSWVIFSVVSTILLLGAGMAVGAIIRIRRRRAEFDNDLIKRRLDKGLNALKNQNESGFPPSRE